MLGKAELLPRVGVSLGMAEMLLVGAPLGKEEDVSLGTDDGMSLGTYELELLGAWLGIDEGVSLGREDGMSLGRDESLPVGVSLGLILLGCDVEGVSDGALLA